MKKIINILLGLFILNSCGSADKGQEVIIDNLYSMRLPNYLINNNLKNEVRSLQYMSEFDELYFHVVDESIDDFKNGLELNDLKKNYATDLDGYSQRQLDNYKRDFDVTYVSEPEKIAINNLLAVSYTLRVKEDSEDIYCRFVLIQGKTHFYKVVIFTLETFEKANKELMEMMIKSFKEL
ncbi:hypothetical protein [Flavobacterium sp. I3-2]|uniref:hypothetical protein n=1 Tax=Flavobacterium sp. I3-2 TaxID=2748319 RepID=UPI0015AE8C40|nr:hypothetical protein [Flavobacterium sp. I3-2]